MEKTVKLPIGLKILAAFYFLAALFFAYQLKKIDYSIVMVFLLLAMILSFATGLGVMNKKRLGWHLSVIIFFFSSVWYLGWYLQETLNIIMNDGVRYGIKYLLSFLKINTHAAYIIMLLMALTYLYSEKVKGYFQIKSIITFNFWEKKGIYLKIVSILELWWGLLGLYALIKDRLNPGEFGFLSTSVYSYNVFDLIFFICAVLGGIGLYQRRLWGWGLSLIYLARVIINHCLYIHRMMILGEMDVELFSLPLFFLFMLILLISCKDFLYTTINKNSEIFPPN